MYTNILRELNNIHINKSISNVKFEDIEDMYDIGFNDGYSETENKCKCGNNGCRYCDGYTDGEIYHVEDEHESLTYDDGYTAGYNHDRGICDCQDEECEYCNGYEQGALDETTNRENENIESICLTYNEGFIDGVDDNYYKCVCETCSYCKGVKMGIESREKLY